MSSAVDFYKLPFKDAKKYLRMIYLDLSFIEDLELDILNLDIKAVYTATSLAPILLVNEKLKINNYISLGPTEQSIIDAKNEKRPVGVYSSNHFLIGYKHADKWKFADGIQIGDLLGQGSVNKELKLQRMIQREVLGFWRFWNLRLWRKI